jgi:hypothetical protein
VLNPGDLGLQASCLQSQSLLLLQLTEADGMHCFEVKGTYNPTTKQLSGPPEEFKAADAMDWSEGTSAAAQAQQLDPGMAMASMDIFAGCGGLSEGMHQVGTCLASQSAANRGQPLHRQQQLRASKCMQQARKCQAQADRWHWFCVLCCADAGWCGRLQVGH